MTTTTMTRAATPGTAMTRALRELGLTNRRHRDKCGVTTRFHEFRVVGVYRRGQRDFTVIAFYTRRAEAVVLENADIVERRCRELGWPVRVRTHTYTYYSKIYDQDVITTRVEVSN